jgi:hypothetical protein
MNIFTPPDISMPSPNDAGGFGCRCTRAITAGPSAA